MWGIFSWWGIVTSRAHVIQDVTAPGQKNSPPKKPKIVIYYPAFQKSSIQYSLEPQIPPTPAASMLQNWSRQCCSSICVKQIRGSLIQNSSVRDHMSLSTQGPRVWSERDFAPSSTGRWQTGCLWEIPRIFSVWLMFSFSRITNTLMHGARIFLLDLLTLWLLVWNRPGRVAACCDLMSFICLSGWKRLSFET